MEYYFQADVSGLNNPRTPTDKFPFIIQFHPDLDTICQENIEFQTDAAFVENNFNLKHTIGDKPTELGNLS